MRVVVQRVSDARVRVSGEIVSEIRAGLCILWNLLLVRARDIQAATAAGLCIAVVLFAPAAVARWRVDADAVPWIAASAALELVYFALVLLALRLAPAAPVAAVRETGVVIAVGLAAIVLRERVGVGRLGGAALVAAGVALLSLA